VLKKTFRSKKYNGLFVVDLDGTLLTSERRLASADLYALFRLRALNYLVAIATGRSNYSFEQLIINLGYSGPETLLPVDYVIFSTGAGIMEFPSRRILKSSALSPEDVRCTADYLEMSGLDYMIHSPVPNTRNFLYSRNGSDNPDFLSRLAIYSKFGTPLSPAALDDCGGATEVLCIVPDKKGHEIADEIVESLDQFSVIKATSPLDGKSIWIEIFAPTVSKSQAVRWLADSVCLQWNNICAVGNDYNDQDLLSLAGHSFMVANGPPSLKQYFRGVASNDNCGVSEAVKLWLENT